jgi:outer membrane protein assembly factor BamA
LLPSLITPHPAHAHSNILHLIPEQVYSQQAEPIYIHSLHIHGLQHTKTSFIKDIFDATLAASTLKSAIDRSRVAVARLQSLDLFDDVSVTFDTPAGAAASAPKGTPDVPLTDDALAIVVKVKEKKRFLARTGTEFGDGEASIVSLFKLQIHHCS